MVVTDDALAAAPDSGVVWQVQPFTRTSLMGSEPSRIGTQPVATSRGAVAKLQVVDWTIPTSLVDASGSVFLGLITTNTDGVNYGNQTGPTPPLLVIELAP